MDVTLYLFDTRMQPRMTLLDEVSELIHKEGAMTLSARIPARARAKPGEYLGMMCVDGRFRVFTIDKAELEDDTGEVIVTATDAAVAELEDSVTLDARGEEMTATQAVEAAIAGTGYRIGKTAAGRTASLNAYYDATWATLQEIADAHDVRIIPYVIFDGHRITRRVIDIEAKVGRKRGRIIEAADGASGIIITQSGRPMTRVYATGAATGTEDPPTRVTLADVAWGNKPQGQAYIDNPALSGMPTRSMVFVDDSEEDAGRLCDKAWEALAKRGAPEVSGNATASDIEMIPGMSHKAIRMYDLIDAKARDGQTAEATVIEIARDYVRLDLTKFTFGRELTADERRKKSLRAQVKSAASAASRAGGRGSAAMNNSVINAAVIQLNAEHIQMNARDILMQTGEITEIEGRVTSAEVEIDGLNAMITLKADATITDELGQRVNSAEIDIDGLNAAITLKASTDDLNGLRNEVSIELDAQANEIRLKADKTYVQTLVADEIEAEIASLETSISRVVTSNTINALNSLTCTYPNFTYGGAKVNKTPLTVVTSFTPALGEAAPTREITLLTVA